MALCTVWATEGYAWLGILPWLLASVGYGAGILLSKSPLPGEGRSWGQSLMSYSLVTAAFSAIAAGGSVFSGLIEMVQASAGLSLVECKALPEVYYSLGMRAFTIMATIAATGFGTALIPIVGPAISNVISVVATLPGLALSATIMIAFTLATFLTIFVTFAPAMIPLGVALLAVPAGKLKGIGGWLIALGLVFSSLGPMVPAIGVAACSGGGEECSLQSIVSGDLLTNVGQGFMNIVEWLLDPKNNLVMQMWRFSLGSMAGWAILMAAASGLSRGIGGVAASLGFG
ncbi:MAG: hypothetical protein B9J98_00870 [Candidatus Terraquivivens tikiterensis]|uniref:Uncharacterized protein n=1 Tax=Candidatus Terraquivivens tikiterensis TaxID=1980982 RepID=A0A2R7Y9U8_9ARCH|nr:MAG: hypothetical protein B9J98_00870 [Candidatus Terraquivivens tikiterensis]